MEIEDFRVIKKPSFWLVLEKSYKIIEKSEKYEVSGIGKLRLSICFVFRPRNLIPSLRRVKSVIYSML